MKKLVLVLSLLWLTPALQADINQVQQLISKQDFGQALKSVERLLSEAPKNHQALFLKAVALQRLGQNDKAIAAYKKLTTEAPSLPEPYNNLAVLYVQQGKHDAARAALLNAINTNKSVATAYKNLSNIYSYMAANAYKKALALSNTKQNTTLSLTTINKLEAKPTAIVVAKIPLIKTLPRIKKKTLTAAKDESELIINTIKGWSNAWSAQDSEAYLSYYAIEFNPPRGLSRRHWENERRIRLKKPSFIRISVKSPIVKMLSANSALLSFKQDYQSDRFHDAVQKTLLLEKTNGNWQILKEFTSS